MRAPTTVLTAGLSATAAVVLLAACGSSADGSGAVAGAVAASSAGSSSTAPGSSAGSTPSGDTATWCGQAVALSSELQQTLTAAASDPTRVAPVLQQAAAKYADVQAPADIAPDWSLVVGAVQTLATAARTIDFTASDAGDRLAASISGQQDALNTATGNVESYAQAHCPGASATPTS
jgi:hypothetical protein